MKPFFLHPMYLRNVVLALLLLSQPTGAQYNFGAPPPPPSPTGNITPLDAINNMTSQLQSLHSTNAYLEGVDQNLGEIPDPSITAGQQPHLAAQGLSELSRNFATCRKKLGGGKDEEEEWDFSDDEDDEEEEEDEEEDENKKGSCSIPDEYDPDSLDSHEDEDDLSCKDSFDIRTQHPHVKAFLDCQNKELKKISAEIECFVHIEGALTKAVQPLQQYLSGQSSIIQDQINLFNEGIGAYEKSMDLIDEDMGGDNGYIGRLAKLEGRAGLLDLQIDGASGTNTNPANLAPQAFSQQGLKERVRQFEDDSRGNMAAKWIRRVRDRTRECFQKQPQTCSSNLGDQTPIECYRTIITGGTGNASSERAAKTYNEKILNHISQSFNTSSDHFNKEQNYGEIDPGSGEQLGEIMNTEYEEMMKNFQNAVRVQKFIGGDAKKLKASILSLSKRHMDNCYKKEIDNFNNALTSNTVDDSNPYNKEIQEYRNQKLNLQKEINETINITTKELTDFETKFTKTFNVELRDFKEECRSTDSVSTSYDCLIKLRRRLNSSIDGTGEAPVAVMRVPSLADKQNPYTEIECKGFKDCVNKLDTTRKMYREERDNLEKSKLGAINAHNDAIRLAVDQTGQIFAQALSDSGMNLDFTSKVLNAKLRSLGVTNASITMEKRDGEDLELEAISSGEGSPSIYKNPKDILAVMGTRSGLMKVGDLQAVKNSIAERRKEIKEKKKKNNKLAIAAKKLENGCRINNVRKNCKNFKNDNAQDDNGNGNCKDGDDFHNEIESLANNLEKLAEIDDFDESCDDEGSYKCNHKFAKKIKDKWDENKASLSSPVAKADAESKEDGITKLATALEKEAKRCKSYEKIKKEIDRLEEEKEKISLIDTEQGSNADTAKEGQLEKKNGEIATKTGELEELKTSELEGFTCKFEKAAEKQEELENKIPSNTQEAGNGSDNKSEGAE